MKFTLKGNAFQQKIMMQTVQQILELYTPFKKSQSKAYIIKKKTLFP